VDFVMGTLLLLLLIIGAPIAYVVGLSKRQSATDARVAALEAEIRRLRAGLRELERPSVGTRPAPPPTSEPSPVEAPALRTPPRPPTEPPSTEPALRPSPVTARVEPVIARREPEAAAPARPAPAWLRWFGEGNALVRVGVVILFFGVAFLLKFVSERVKFPIEARLGAVALAAVGLIVFGWRVRRARPGYGLSLQGGGIGILYLTVYAAFRLYHLMPPTVAFGLMLAIVVLSGVLAARQDSMALAILGATGGFLAPLLASTGQGSHVALFSYYALLNVGILGLAWVRAWRPLNLLGFLGTFVIATAWGALSYRPENFATTEPFLMLFFAMYLGIAILYARRRSIQLQHYVDGTIVFGTPLVGFALQGRLLEGVEHGLAWTAAALAALYLLLSRLLRHPDIKPSVRMLTDAFLGLGICFGTLAIPLAFEARPTSALWAIEGAAIVWAGVRQQRPLAQWFGIALQVLAGLAFLAPLDWAAPAQIPVVNSECLGMLLLSFAAIFAARQLAKPDVEPGTLLASVADALFIVGVGWWIFAGSNEIDRFLAARWEVTALIGFAALTAALSIGLRRWLDWEIALLPPLVLLPALYLLAVVQLLPPGREFGRPFADAGWLVWPAAFAVLTRFLKRHEEDGSLLRSAAPFLHAAAVWLAMILLTAEARWFAAHWLTETTTWQWVVLLTVPAFVLLLLVRATDGGGWPFGAHGVTHLRVTSVPIVVYLVVVIVYASFISDGSPAPLPYAPLLNPLDLSCLLAFVAIFAWHRHVLARGLNEEAASSAGPVALGAVGFVWFNAVLLRTLHFWIHVPYTLDDLLASQVVQTSLTVFWTTLAVTGMFLATRRGLRLLWLVGAALLGVVVLKLFLFDLSQLSGIRRIVSFIGVGVLLLAIGYFSPVPPKDTVAEPRTPA
jgi:uncharacterized membrane protein